MTMEDIEDIVGDENGGIDGFRSNRQPLVYVNVSNLDKKRGVRNPRKKQHAKSLRKLQARTNNNRDENENENENENEKEVGKKSNGCDTEKGDNTEKGVIGLSNIFDLDRVTKKTEEEHKQLENKNQNQNHILSLNDLSLYKEEDTKESKLGEENDYNHDHIDNHDRHDHRDVDEISLGSTSELDSECAENTALIPGTESIWLKTFGCSHNVSDSEYMQGLLGAYGYQFVDEYDREAADIWVINSCTVKDPSQSAFTNIIKRAQQLHIPMVVCGCVPQADRKLKDLDGISMVGIQQIDRVVEVVEQTLLGNTVRLLAKGSLPSLDLPKIRKNPMIEIVPLSTGCLGACTYCKTKHARGALGSYTVDAIVSRITKVISEGVTEVWLSSEDTGAYGRDINTTLSILLEAILPILPHDVMLRIGMTNPPFILDQLPAVAQALNHPNVFTFLHIPVQSGSDNTLLGMNREYTSGEFRQVANYLLKHVPGMTIATDIICGFPGETDEDFEQTLALVNQYEFPILNISQFYPRPGTPAAKMKRIPTKIVKDRSRKLTLLFGSYHSTKNINIGDITKIWINTEVADDGIHNVGHTKGYVKVLVPYSDDLIGSTATVKITSLARFHVTAELTAPDAYRPINPDHPLNLHEMIRLNRSNILMTHGPKTRLSNLDREDYGEEDEDGDNENASVSSRNSMRSTRSNKSIASNFSTLSSRSHSNPAKNILPALINKAGIDLDMILEENPSENNENTEGESGCCGGEGGCSSASGGEGEKNITTTTMDSGCCMDGNNQYQSNCCSVETNTEYESETKEESSSGCCGGGCGQGPNSSSLSKEEQEIELEMALRKVLDQREEQKRKENETQKENSNSLIEPLLKMFGTHSLYLVVFSIIYAVVYTFLKKSELIDNIFLSSD